MLALLLRAAATTLGGCTTLIAVVVVVVVGLQDTLPQLLLPSMDIRVELVSVLANRELLIIIDRDANAACAHRFVLCIMELCDIRVS